jgi:hypothetical protein
MDTKKNLSWGSPRDWGVAIGILIAAIGLLSLISSVWTPDAATAAATGFLGFNAIVPSVIILVVGLVVAGVSQFLIKPRA